MGCCLSSPQPQNSKTNIYICPNTSQIVESKEIIHDFTFEKAHIDGSYYSKNGGPIQNFQQQSIDSNNHVLVIVHFPQSSERIHIRAYNQKSMDSSVFCIKIYQHKQQILKCLLNKMPNSLMIFAKQFMEELIKYIYALFDKFQIPVLKQFQTSLQNIKNLSLCNTNWKDQYCKHLYLFPNLQYLDIRQNKQITVDAVKHLKKLNLQTLIIGCQQMQKQPKSSLLSKLSQIKKLKSLQLQMFIDGDDFQTLIYAGRLNNSTDSYKSIDCDKKIQLKVNSLYISSYQDIIEKNAWNDRSEHLLNILLKNIIEFQVIILSDLNPQTRMIET